MTADDGTQRRIFQTLDEAGIGTTQIATWLGVPDTIVSDMRAGRRCLHPWMQLRIAKRHMDAAPVVGEIVAAAGQMLVPRPTEVAASSRISRATIQLGRAQGALCEAVAVATDPDSEDGEEFSRREREEVLDRVRSLIRDAVAFEAQLSGLVLRVAR